LVDVDGKDSPFYIDTGVSEIYFPPSIILGKTKNEYKKILLPKRKKSELKTRNYYLVTTDKIAVFDDLFENKTIITNSPASFGADPNITSARGVLGVEFLKNYDLLFDFTNMPYSTSGLYYKRISIERDEKKLFPWDKARVERILESGIYSFYRTPDGITLGIIEGSFLNKEHGVTEKTVITKIDGKTVREISDTELWNTDFSKVKDFAFLDNGEERTRVFSLGNR
jgi:hypothetical protein